MKTKLKKWHMLLMSFITLFITVFASLFNLRADSIDNETGEVLTDNWELNTVFYDSTVDNGKTPLTEINWDASNGNYTVGDTREITVQINYKNNNAVTTYQPGELEITIPNLIFSGEGLTSRNAQWIATAIVGANDSTHSGYDWNFTSGQTPDRTQEYYFFTNANIIEEKSNFEGNIQIVYTITASSEIPEAYIPDCIHNYNIELQATLCNTGSRMVREERLTNTEYTITSPNWPNNYHSNLSASRNYWEYTSPTLENLKVYFDKTSRTESSYDNIYIYDKTGSLLYTLSGTQMAGKTFEIEGNYVKIAFSSDGSGQYKGFRAFIGSGDLEIITTIPENMILSNKINFNYTRTYIHPWQELKFTLNKKASKITALDGLPTGDYYWVKYTFETVGNRNASYPYAIPSSFKLTDAFPQDCIILDQNLNLLTIENNLYETTSWDKSDSSSYLYEYLFVGYPKSIYNENAQNLLIENTANLDVKFSYDNDYRFEDDATVSINLADFEFTYSGNLYGISKTIESTSYSIRKLFYQSLANGDSELGSGGKIYYSLTPTAIYSGQLMDVKFGDDLLYITNTNGLYRKLNDDEYYFSSISFPSTLKNGNNQTIEKGKYNCELWIRYANQDSYILYEEFTNESKTWTFTKDNAVVGYYYVIKNMQESIKGTNFNGVVTIYNAKNIAVNSGYIYNFAYVQVYIDGVLQNEPTLDSYSNFITKDEIATFDQNTYGTYMQRTYSSGYYSYFKITPEYDFRVGKTMGTLTQNAESEVFLGTTTISLEFDRYNTSAPSDYQITTYGSTLTENEQIKGWEIYDLLPEGMELTSTSDEILNSLYLQETYQGSFVFYNTNLQKISNEDFEQLIKENATIIITKNYKNTGRTYVYVKIDLTNSPIYFFGGDMRMYSFPIVNFNYNYSISYDSYLEFGSVWTNHAYAKYYNQDLNNTFKMNRIVKDNGQNDIDETDINNNGDKTESLSYISAAVTITSVISSHQDVTTYVKTDQSNYSTGTVDTSCNSEYEYKLRVRTGSADVTNLILYTNIEEAQKGRTRWKGEFLEIDTSYAENKGYKVKPYYSENTEAGNLYNEDGTLNSDWKEYVYDTPAVYAQGLEIKFNSQSRTEHISCDYVEIYYVLDGVTYKLGKWGEVGLAGTTIQIPSNDFYLYWHTDSSVSYYYGFSIDSITYKPIENTNTTTGVIPSYDIEEIKDNTYPDSAFGSYTHGNYGNNVNKIWHYTYTGEKQIVQESVEGTDKDKVKSLAFEYLDAEGNPAVLPANSLTYVLIKMKSPADENETRLARMDCRTQWNALDEFDRPVDFITGINSNVVKVALPNSVDEDSSPSISLRFTKEITGTDSEFENMKLDKTAQQSFMIRLTDLAANEDGNYNQVTALLKSDQELIINQIPVGTYLLEELGDNYFDFVEFTNNNDPEIVIEGVTFERTNQGYILTISEDLTENIEFNIKVTNEIEPERFYEDKDNKENLFLKNKIEQNS